MKIKITTEQYNEIQNEVIKLENIVSDTRDEMNGWDFQFYDTKIAILKEILKTEEIDLDQIF